MKMSVKKVLWVVFMGMMLNTMAVNASTLKVGDYVQMGKFYDEPLLWRCVSEDDNGALMLTDRIITLRAFDAKGKHNNDYKSLRRLYGSNRWENSNLRSWLNSAADKGKVEWACQNAPTKSAVWNGYNAYSDDAGFMNGFTENQKSVIKAVSQKQILSYREAMITKDKSGTEVHVSYSAKVSDSLKNYDTAFSYMLSDKVFVLDMKQLVDVYNNKNILGEDYYIGKISDQCFAKSEYQYGLSKDGNWHTWLRTPYATAPGAETVRHLWNNGWVERTQPYLSYIGVRPAFYINMDKATVSGEGTAEKPYIIE